jgi:hypothetical protein
MQKCMREIVHVTQSSHSDIRRILHGGLSMRKSKIRGEYEENKKKTNNEAITDMNKRPLFIGCIYFGLCSWM